MRSNKNFIVKNGYITWTEKLPKKAKVGELKKFIEKTIRRFKKDRIDAWVEEIHHGSQTEIVFYGKKRKIFARKNYLPDAITCFTTGSPWEGPEEFVRDKQEKMEKKYKTKFEPEVIDQIGSIGRNDTLIIITMKRGSE